MASPVDKSVKSTSSSSSSEDDSVFQVAKTGQGRQLVPGTVSESVELSAGRLMASLTIGSGLQPRSCESLVEGGEQQSEPMFAFSLSGTSSESEEEQGAMARPKDVLSPDVEAIESALPVGSPADSSEGSASSSSGGFFTRRPDDVTELLSLSSFGSSASPEEHPLKLKLPSPEDYREEACSSIDSVKTITGDSAKKMSEMDCISIWREKGMVTTQLLAPLEDSTVDALAKLTFEKPVVYRIIPHPAAYEKEMNPFGREWKQLPRYDRPYIVKIIMESLADDDERSAVESAELELDIIKKLSHANIVKRLDDRSDRDQTYLDPKATGWKVTEVNIFVLYMEDAGIDLYKHLKTLGREVVFSELVLYGLQLLAGLCYLKKKKIVHRDIKPTNLLVGECIYGNIRRLRIADFGFSFYANIPIPKDDISGSILFLAPEVKLAIQAAESTSKKQAAIASGHPQTYQSDLYAAGMSFVKLLLDMGFLNDSVTRKGLRKAEDKGDIGVEELLPHYQNNEIAKELLVLINQMREKDPEKRPVVEEMYKAFYNLAKKIDSQCALELARDAGMEVLMGGK